MEHLPGAKDEDRFPLPLVMGGQGRPDWKIGMKRDVGGAAETAGGVGPLTGLARFRRLRRLQRRYDRLQRHRERERVQVLSDFGNPARGIIIGLGVTIAVGLLGRCACAVW